MTYFEEDEDRVRKRGEPYYEEENYSDAFRDERLAAIDRMFEDSELLTPQELGIAYLYYRCGLSQGRIAYIFRISRQRVSFCMQSIQKKISM